MASRLIGERSTLATQQTGCEIAQGEKMTKTHDAVDTRADGAITQEEWQANYSQIKTLARNTLSEIEDR